MKKICDECKGTGLKIGPIRPERAISCIRCDGKGFTEVTSLVNGEKEFHQKKRLEGIKDVILLAYESLRSEYTGTSSFKVKDSHGSTHFYSVEWSYPGFSEMPIGTIPYEDFVTDNVNLQTVSLHPESKKYRCPGFILEHMLQKGREVECLFCSGKASKCPLKPWQRTENLRAYCWKSFEEALNPPSTTSLELSEEEYKILKDSINLYSLSILKAFQKKYISIDALYTFLSLKWKIFNTPSEKRWEDVFLNVDDIPMENQQVAKARKKKEEEFDPERQLKKMTEKWLTGSLGYWKK